jgi:dihydromethanopterin reductase
MAGPVTAASIPRFAREDRIVVELRSSMPPEEALARFPDRIVYIGGGPPVWDAYSPFIRHWDITVLPYDGEADRWFDPGWLTRAGSATR